MSSMYVNGDKIEMHIRKRETFTIGNMSGDWYSSGTPEVSGRLPRWGRLAFSDPIRQEMLELLKDRDLYVVYSYLTPIAYGYDKTLRIPDVTYSQITTGHQHTVRMANTFGTLPPRS